jgi:uncharacterized cupin superfamily protein
MTQAKDSKLRLETQAMDGAQVTPSPPHTKVEAVTLQGRRFTRFTFYPGFHWQKDAGPIAKATHCPADHFMYQVSGRLRVRMKDGTEALFEAGQAQVLPAGHDVWVEGDEPFVAISID